jgi:hypothetical protein
MQCQHAASEACLFLKTLAHQMLPVGGLLLRRKLMPNKSRCPKVRLL